MDYKPIRAFGGTEESLEGGQEMLIIGSGKIKSAQQAQLSDSEERSFLS